MKRQEKSKTPMIAAMVALVLIVVVAAAFFVSARMSNRNTSGIVLPDGNVETATAVEPMDSQNAAQDVASVTITKENAKAVVAALKRPTAYSCHIVNTLYYTDSAGTRMSSAFYLNRYVKSSLMRTNTMVGDAVRSAVLRDGDTVYAWDTGSTSYYQGTQGGFGDDATAMMPTYEDILSDDVALLDAGNSTEQGAPCIFVSFEQNGYRCEYNISAITGLLLRASFTDENGVLMREVVISDINTEAPADDIFVLPDGTALAKE